MKALKAALISHPCVEDSLSNQQNIEKLIREAAKQGAQLICLQELHNNLYFCQTEDLNHFDLAESIPGPSSHALGQLAKELSVVIVASLFEKRAAGIYHNTAVVLEADGSLAGRYRKMHIPDDPGFYEKFYFTPGDLGFKPIETSVGKLGILICWDQWYPEAARLMALSGAEILIYPTAIGWDQNDSEIEQNRQLEAWLTVQRGHAVANNLPVLSINRTGHEADPSGCTSGIHFWGHSFACGSQGEWLARQTHSSAITLADISIQQIEQTRRVWPFFRDRRIDAFDLLVKRYID